MQSSQEKINERFSKLAQNKRLLPIKISSFYQKKIDEEVEKLGHFDGPLHHVGYPSLERITLSSKEETANFVDDKGNMKEGEFIVQKYVDRILFLVTHNCIANCQYCCRQDILCEKNEEPSLDQKLSLLENYVRGRPSIKEVILSGGDPLALPFFELKTIIDRLKSLNLESIRVHTRSIVYNPFVFTDDKLRLFKESDVRLVFHIVHPYEICMEVEKTIYKIVDHKIRCYNQFPLLRGVNDHSEVLIKHLKLLDKLFVRNLSIYMPEPISHSMSFRIHLARMFKIIDEVNKKTPSWVNATRFVLDTPIGKVRREDLKRYEPGKFAIFERDQKEIKYLDLPEELDKPSDLKILLFKEY
ncbi:MAG: radical SAM protein [Chlamydiae bacterium]|nr:radical SAM protein [Chlamydiota bacterium]